MAAEKKQNFETKIKKLEKIVQDMEDETLDLEKSVKMFEEGIKLSGELTRELKEIKFKIERLKKDAQGKLSTESFDE